MDFDVYCDESLPDLLTSGSPGAQYLVIGGLWLPSADREDLKGDIHKLRDVHRIGGEFKWQKTSPSKQGFYTDLIDLFISRGDRLRFRCIAVDRTKVNLMRYHGNDHELGFYKFYYQLLHNWILDFNEYSIFCDYKSNRVRDRVQTLGKILVSANLTSSIRTVQAVRSEESVLIQLADTLTGIASARINESIREGGAKEHVVLHLESLLGQRIAPTFRSEHKFNVFRINLDGGW